MTRMPGDELRGFAKFVDAFPWTKFLIFLAATFFVVTGAALAGITIWALTHPDFNIDPETARVLDVWLGHVVNFSGVAVVGAGIKRAATKSDVIRAETDRVVQLGEANITATAPKDHLHEMGE